MKQDELLLTGVAYHGNRILRHVEDDMRVAKRHKKGHHVWVQGYDIPKGWEDDIILATDAAYDAGARTIVD